MRRMHPSGRSISGTARDGGQTSAHLNSVGGIDVTSVLYDSMQVAVLIQGSEAAAGSVVEAAQHCADDCPGGCVGSKRQRVGSHIQGDHRVHDVVHRQAKPQWAVALLAEDLQCGRRRLLCCQHPRQMPLLLIMSVRLASSSAAFACSPFWTRCACLLSQLSVRAEKQWLLCERKTNTRSEESSVLTSQQECNALSHVWPMGILQAVYTCTQLCACLSNFVTTRDHALRNVATKHLLACLAPARPPPQRET